MGKVRFLNGWHSFFASKNNSPLLTAAPPQVEAAESDVGNRRPSKNTASVGGRGDGGRPEGECRNVNFLHLKKNN